jgi:hypothetical protein
VTDRDKINELRRTVDDLARQMANLPVRWADGGGGGNTSNLRAIAYVTSTADKSTFGYGITGGTVGKAVLLDEDMQPSVPLDPNDPEYDSEEVEGAEIEFKALHRVDIPVGAIVELSSANPIEPGSSFEENKVWGRRLDEADIPGYEADKDQSLGHDEGGSAYRWQDDTECPPQP